MLRIDDTVKKETTYIAVWTLIFSVILQAVFLIIGKWDITVFLGNVLSYAVSILNFFLIGLTVQKAVEKEEKEAKDTMKLSQSLRMLMIFAVVCVGVAFPVFNNWSVIIPLLFPRVAIALSSVLRKEKSSEEEGKK